jgi:hypothetical protein
MEDQVSLSHPAPLPLLKGEARMKRNHFVSLCEIEDRANFNYVVARAVFPESHRARLWADAYIANRRLKAIRKYGADFQEALFGLEPTFRDLEFDPAREPVDVEA